MKQNKIFEQVLRESLPYNEPDNKLKVSTDIFNKPLNRIFDEVLTACENENSFDYTNLSVNKKSTPFNNLPLNKAII